MTKASFRLLFLLIIFLVAIFIFYFPNFAANNLGHESVGLLTVSFLDVGQGDSIFIETPDGVQVLIDGGGDGTVLRQLPKQMPFLDKTIDMVLATHSDKDHIGGLVDVLKRYQVDTIVETKNKNATAVASAFVVAVSDEKAKVYSVTANQEFRLGASTTLLILSPTGDSTEWESNTASIVAQLKYGEVEFMFTGDAPKNIEEYIVKKYGGIIESEVLKLGHHGSRTSTADLFLDTVTPQYAIVSAEKNSRYGHPHQEVLDKVSIRGIRILNTADEGNIVFKSDGDEVWVE